MKQILLVEPDAEYRELLSVTLTAAGYEAAVASDGQKALEIVLAGGVDLVILEPEISGISGVDLIDLLETTPNLKPIKIFILAKSLSKKLREKILKYNIEQYWFKNQAGLQNIVDEVRGLLAEPDIESHNDGSNWAN